MFSDPRNPIEKEICELEKSICTTREKIQTLRAKLPEELVQDYKLKDLAGNPTTLSELFGKSDELLLIHNMGPDCPYCTLWADGLRSMKPYFKSRCAFALETDVEPGKLSEFAKSRGWDFNVVSSAGSSLKTDLGFKIENSNRPGVSSFFKRDGKLYRHATAPFGPGDDFANIWHFFSLLKHPDKKWQPTYNR